MKNILLRIFCGLGLVAFVTFARADEAPLAPADVPYSFPVKHALIDGRKLAYIDEGQGQTMLFVHGLSTTLSTFDPLLPVMIKNGYRVIAVDLFGYGKSDKPDVAYSVPFHAATVAALVRHLKLKDVILVGHSMGAAISLQTALHEPDGIRALVLLTPGGLNETAWFKRLILKGAYEQVYGNRFSDIERARKYYRESVYQWTPAMDGFLKTRERQMRHPDWVTVRRTIREGAQSAVQIPNEILPRVAEIKIPVLVLLGNQDKIVPSSEIKANVEKRTTWEIDSFERCGHMIQFEHPDKVNERVLLFARKLKP